MTSRIDRAIALLERLRVRRCVLRRQAESGDVRVALYRELARLGLRQARVGRWIAEHLP